MAQRPKTIAHQLALPLIGSEESAKHFSDAVPEERGAIYTRREVVEFILDLVGYSPDKPLHEYRILEPSFGEGDFLIPIVERLLVAYSSQEPAPGNAADILSPCVRAVEIHPSSIEHTSTKLRRLLKLHGLSEDEIQHLLDAWLVHGDFLLEPLEPNFTHVAGNPPYIRQEQIPDGLLSEYRARYRTIYDRADLYVPFIEHSLELLKADGALGFICADRWMKNKYGAPLRELVANHYHLACYVDMVGTDAFHSEVSAYPAITVIERKPPGATRIALRPEVSEISLRRLGKKLTAKRLVKNAEVLEVAGVASGREPWLLQSFEELALVRRLEAEFPPLEGAGCKVGIGVATGADKVFIAPYDELDVEATRKLPLATTKDIAGSCVEWKGLGVLNPFEEDGTLADLKQYPKFARHLQEHEDTIRNRNCAKKNPRNWYRTIDRIYPELARRPKLLIPDIKGTAHIVYEDGRLYPHHNLYFIVSDQWDLHALRGVLMSGIARLFVSMYSTQMRGGYLRFQAQYLRRIRLPHWADVPIKVRKSLSRAAETGDTALANRATCDLYRLTSTEATLLNRTKPNEH